MSTRTLKRFAFMTVMTAMVANAYAVREGFYLGAQTGASKTHYQSEFANIGGTFVTVTPKNSGFGARLFGGYQAQYYGFEMGYTYFSNIKYDLPSGTTGSDPTARLQAVDFQGKVIWPFFDSGFDVFGKVGIAGAVLQRSVSLQESGESKNKALIRPVAGVGASYTIAQNWVADLSWTRLFSRGLLGNVDFYALGVSYHFVDTYCGQFLC